MIHYSKDVTQYWSDSSEQQARGLLQSEDSRREQKCGTILNNEGQMDFHNATGQLSIVFRNMVTPTDVFFSYYLWV